MARYALSCGRGGPCREEQAATSVCAFFVPLGLSAGFLLPRLLAILQELPELLVFRGDTCPTLGGGAPPIIPDRHVDAAIDEELHGLVVFVPHQFMQDAGWLMGAPVRIDIGAVCEKKVGDLEVVVEDGPRERGVENPLRIGALAEPASEVRAVMGIVNRKMSREVAQSRFPISVEPTSHPSEA